MPPVAPEDLKQYEACERQIRTAIDNCPGYKCPDLMKHAFIHLYVVGRVNGVDQNNMLAMVKKLARLEGLLVSPSAAANLLGAIEVAKDLEQGVVVTTFADNAEKYAEVLAQINQKENL